VLLLLLVASSPTTSSIMEYRVQSIVNTSPPLPSPAAAAGAAASLPSSAAAAAGGCSAPLASRFRFSRAGVAGYLSQPILTGEKEPPFSVSACSALWARLAAAPPGIAAASTPSLSISLLFLSSRGGGQEGRQRDGLMKGLVVSTFSSRH